jgi:arylsulfatase A-like enzyme
VGGETNQWSPTLFLGTSPVEPPATAKEGYHFSEDITDKAISWIRGLDVLTPDKPLYVESSSVRPYPLGMWLRHNPRRSKAQRYDSCSENSKNRQVPLGDRIAQGRVQRMEPFY